MLWWLSSTALPVPPAGPRKVEMVRCPLSALLLTSGFSAVTAVGATVFVGGNYRKYARNIPQSQWIDRGERIGVSSVEEIIRDLVLPVTGGSATLGASGREVRLVVLAVCCPQRNCRRKDRNVRMVGPSRPFYLQIVDAKRQQVESEIAALRLPQDCPVQISQLAVLSQAQVDLINRLGVFSGC